MNESLLPAQTQPVQTLQIRIFGIGNAGIHVLEHLAGPEIPLSAMVAMDTPGDALSKTKVPGTIALGPAPNHRLSGSGDPEQTKKLAEGQMEQVRSLCQGQDVVFVISALGGGTGSGVAPLLARIAKDSGALVLAFVFTPFDLETTRRRQFASKALADLKGVVDGVVCLPNQQVLKSMDPQTRFTDAFRLCNQLLADAVRGIWRLLVHKGLIEIHFADLAAILRESQSACAFAVAEASGANRVDEVLRSLLSNPILAESSPTLETGTALISLIAGPELTMAEVNQVMSGISGHYSGAQIVMGAAVSDEFNGRISVTLLVSRQAQASVEPIPTPVPEAARISLIDPPATLVPDRAPSTPPTPNIPASRLALGAPQEKSERSSQRNSVKMRQVQLPLNIVNKGRFEKSEPTLHKGEDLDIPTYVRRGLGLN